MPRVGKHSGSQRATFTEHRDGDEAVEQSRVVDLRQVPGESRQFYGISSRQVPVRLKIARQALVLLPGRPGITFSSLPLLPLPAVVLFIAPDRLAENVAEPFRLLLVHHDLDLVPLALPERFLGRREVGPMD